MLLSLVIVHEWGHFKAARRAGIEVEEFGIGFPPRAKVLTEKNGTKYTLNWLPLGGFVKLKGEHDSDNTKGSYGASTLWQKVQVMLAGVVMNLLVAVLLLSIVAAVRLPKVLDNQFSIASDNTVVTQEVIAGFVVEESPAEQAGLEAGDVLQKIEVAGCSGGDCSRSLTKEDDLRQATQAFAGQAVNITYERNNNTLETSTTLRTVEEVEASQDTDDPKGHLGVVPNEYVETKATWSAPIVGTVFSGQVVIETLKSFGSIVADLFRGDTTTASEQVTGVVGIGYILGELSQQGLVSILFLTGLISLSLAVMNILPIPALDGGRLFVTLLFRLFKKPLTKETEERIHGTGFMLLMLLFVLITIVDVQRFIF